MPAALPDALKHWFTRALRSVGYQLVNLRRLYDFDGLHTTHKPRFQDDPRFQAAWQRGREASYGDSRGDWRVHIGLWAASVASRVPGDFVECGVNAGFLSSAILNYLDWASLGKTFYLVDTFQGPVLEQYSAEEVERGHQQRARQAMVAEQYLTDLERVRRNYREWERIEIVQGSVPQVLPSVHVQTVAFLHLDMNCAFPETEALRYFWARISPGGIVLLDDYNYFDYDAQGNALDAVARDLGAGILSLPTGQGMIVK